jgi:hypothetical protein
LPRLAAIRVRVSYRAVATQPLDLEMLEIDDILANLAVGARKRRSAPGEIESRCRRR